MGDSHTIFPYAARLYGFDRICTIDCATVAENNKQQDLMASNPEALQTPARRLRPQTIRLSQSIVVGSAALLDAFIIAGLGWLVFSLYVGVNEPERQGSYSMAIAILTLLVVQSYSVAGIYRFGRVIHPAHQVRRMVLVLTGVFLILVTVAFGLKISDEFSRVWAFAWLISAAVCVPLARFGLRGLIGALARRGHLGRNIIVYGAGQQGADLIRHIETINEPWNRIVGVFDDRRTRTAEDLLGVPVLGDIEQLRVWARDNRVDEVLIALPWAADKRLMTITHMLSVLPADIRLSPEFVGSDILHRRTTYQYRVPMVSVLEKPVAGWPALIKTILDYLLGTLFLLLSLPLLIAIVVAIKLDSRGPVLFRQKRYGFNNQLIDVFKFRTMYVEQLDADADRLTQRNDPRVTRVGAFLRRFSLDELPQLFNVLRGEMSVVGPRPHALKAKAGDTLYEDVIDQYAVRHKVKPGITGWAQVNGWRGNTETEADLLGRVEHDLYYIDNWSIMLDLYILALTVFAVIRGENSY